MKRLIFSDQAVADLIGIADYITDISSHDEVGNRFAEEIEIHCRKLARLPGLLGRNRPELSEGLRSIPHKSYLIFFRYRDDIFEVVTIIGAERDLDAYFAEAKI